MGSGRISHADTPVDIVNLCTITSNGVVHRPAQASYASDLVRKCTVSTTCRSGRYLENDRLLDNFKKVAPVPCGAGRVVQPLERFE